MATTGRSEINSPLLILTEPVGSRLANADAVKRARVFPYQLLMAFKAAGGDVLNLIRDALQDAMEVATENVPRTSATATSAMTSRLDSNC